MNEGNGVVDALSFVVLLGTLTQILPPLAALFTIVWTGIRIYEWARSKQQKDISND